MRIVLVTLLSLVAAQPALAGPPGLTDARIESETRSEAAEVRVLGGKREEVAVGLTLLGIAAPVALLIYGANQDTDNPVAASFGALATLPGPSIGQWYANRWGGVGLGIRFLGFTSVLGGLEEIDNAKRCARGIEVTDGCADVSERFGRGAVVVGLAAVAASWVWDVLAARRAVPAYNKPRTVMITPSAMRLNDDLSVGLAVGAQF